MLKKFKVKKLLKGLKTKAKLDKTMIKNDVDLKVRFKMVKAQDKF